MNYLQRNFIYLSQMVDIPVIDDASGRAIGRVDDIVAGIKEMYPRVSGMTVRSGWSRRRMFVPWTCVRRLAAERAVHVADFNAAAFQGLAPQRGEILLRRTFWDKQIVDVSGSKVVRVNDLHLLREGPNFWVVHMDVGFKGLIRRLGWSRFVTFMMRWLFSYELKDRFLSWKVVQPITTEKGSELLSLRTPGMRLAELHPADLADILIDLGTGERVVILKTLDDDLAARTLEELPMHIRLLTAELLDQTKLASIIGVMSTDEAVDLVAKFPRKKRNALLAVLPREKAAQVSELLQLSSHTAGGIMTTEFVTARVTMAAGQLLERLRAESRHKEIYYIYVMDAGDVLTGIVTLRQLLTAAPERPLAEFMRRRVTRVRVDTDVKHVAQVFYKYDFTVVPVVDRQNRLQGIVTIKDAFESVHPEIREESEETK
jgi:CBS domain-containing protein/sporulation protein YlmC with PRC-barrel domain